MLTLEIQGVRITLGADEEPNKFKKNLKKLKKVVDKDSRDVII